MKKSDYLKLLNVSSPYYLELDASFYILSIGDNFLKSVSNIKVKTSVFDYFLLDRKVEIIVDQLPDHWFDKMHFLELKGNLQRYKFSIVKQDSSYF